MSSTVQWGQQFYSASQQGSEGHIILKGVKSTLTHVCRNQTVQTLGHLADRKMHGSLSAVLMNYSHSPLCVRERGVSRTEDSAAQPPLVTELLFHSCPSMSAAQHQAQPGRAPQGKLHTHSAFITGLWSSLCEQYNWK